MEESTDNIINILSDINKNLVIINSKLINIEKNVIIECKKMGSHINFVENVYENVKQPLGYINNKIKQIIGSGNTYNIDNIEYNINDEADTD